MRRDTDLEVLFAEKGGLPLPTFRQHTTVDLIERRPAVPAGIVSHCYASCEESESARDRLKEIATVGDWDGKPK